MPGSHRIRSRFKLCGQRAALAVHCAVAVFGLARAASAGACQDLFNPVYVTGSSVIQPELAALAGPLTAAETATVVYKSGTSCAAAAAFNSTQPAVITGTAIFWDATGAQGTCDLGAGANVDLGVSDVFAATCSTPLASHVGDSFGPVQSFVFAVPKSATTSSISDRAAYMVYGFGGDKPISPWNNAANLKHQLATSSAQMVLGAAIGVPANKWLPAANALANSSAVVSALASPQGDPQSTLGILGADTADANRVTIKTLAFQDASQSCGYWPDSASAAYDKQNVRDGHYPLWAPLHFFYRTTDAGTPVSILVKALLDPLTGRTTVTNTSLEQVEISKGLIPACAMRVTRTSEAGPLQSYMPSHSCECFYLKTLGASLPESCTPCSTQAQCSTAAVCSYGYCEIQ